MTLSVSPNSDGTITITCGNDSVTIDMRATSKREASAPPLWPTSGTVLWLNSGATAAIVAGGKAKTKVIRIASRHDLLKAIREQHDLHIQTPEPTIFQFHVQGSEPLSVEEINKALSDLGNPEWMGTQIKLTGPDDE